MKRFSASRISELLMGGQGKTRLNYIYDVATENVGIESTLKTKAMEHGTINQYEAFQTAFQPLYGGAWYDMSIFINKNLSASPDIVDLSFTADIKCPYSIASFFEQCDSLPKKYYDQLQTQMLALDVKWGYCCFYLTKPDEFGVEWKEYPFTLPERTFIHEVKQDEQRQEEILTAAEQSAPELDYLIDLLGGAALIDDEYFFRSQFLGTRFTDLKTLAWSRYNSCLRYNDKFYIEKAGKT